MKNIISLLPEKRDKQKVEKNKNSNKLIKTQNGKISLSKSTKVNSQSTYKDSIINNLKKQLIVAKHTLQRQKQENKKVVKLSEQIKSIKKILIQKLKEKQQKQRLQQQNFKKHHPQEDQYDYDSEQTWKLQPRDKHYYNNNRNLIIGGHNHYNNHLAQFSSSNNSNRHIKGLSKLSSLNHMDSGRYNQKERLDTSRDPFINFSILNSQQKQKTHNQEGQIRQEDKVNSIFSNSLTNSKALIDSETSSHTYREAQSKQSINKFMLTKMPKSKETFGKYKSNATE